MQIKPGEGGKQRLMIREAAPRGKTRGGCLSTYALPHSLKGTASTFVCPLGRGLKSRLAAFDAKRESLGRWQWIAPIPLRFDGNRRPVEYRQAGRPAQTGGD